MFTWISRLLKKRPIARRTLHLLTCQIHGSHYYQCLELVSADKIRRGQQLWLQREGDNEYDEYAIEVLTQEGIKLGYVPKNYNRVIATLMDQRCAISAVVERVVSTDWEPVSIRIEWRSGD